MKFFQFCPFESMCMDVAMSDAGEGAGRSVTEIFAGSSPAEKRAEAKRRLEMAQSLERDAQVHNDRVQAEHGYAMEVADSSMAGKLMFFDNPDLRAEKQLYCEHAIPFEQGMTAVQGFMNAARDRRSEASQLVWSARRDEFAGFVQKIGNELKSLLRLG